MYTTDNRPEPLGQVLCFVSAKGGTGKTVISATAAYTLLQAGLRVVTIDADFSTRGLSLYLLGNVLNSSELNIYPKNCLADAILDRVPIEKVTPLPVVNAGVEYQLIISNRDVFRGGVPDERFLGGNLSEQAATSPREYFDFLRRLCDRLRREFDYVIIDTRGGYDFTSATPAAVADGYIVVLEADMVSIEQVGGFKKKVDDFADSLSEYDGRRVVAALKGFVINKAIFSVDEELFPRALERLYESKTFGVIPADNDVIRSYQRKFIPLDKYPASDFSYHSLLAIEHITSPSLNWRSPQCEKRFYRILSSVKGEWAARRKVERLQGWIPALLIALAAVSIVFYLFFKEGAFASALQFFYAALAAFMILAVLSSMLRFIAFMQKEGMPKSGRYSVAGLSLAVMLGLLYLTTYDIPQTFSKDPLLKLIREKDDAVAAQRKEIDALQKEKGDMAADKQVLEADRQQIQQSLSDRDSQISDLQTQLTTLRVQASSLRRDRDAAQSNLQSANDQNASLKDQLDKCRCAR